MVPSTPAPDECLAFFARQESRWLLPWLSLRESAHLETSFSAYLEIYSQAESRGPIVSNNAPHQWQSY